MAKRYQVDRYWPHIFDVVAGMLTAFPEWENDEQCAAVMAAKAVVSSNDVPQKGIE